MSKKGIKLETVLEILKFDDKDLDIEISELNFEEINNLNDLFGSILELGLREIKQFGFKKSYVNRYRELSKIKGKIDFGKSINKGAVSRGKLVCKVGELSINNIYNQVIKYAILSIFKGRLSDTDESEVLSRSIRIRLLQYLDILKFVDDIHNVDFSKASYIKTSAPFYYAKALNTALYIIQLYTSIDNDGSSRFGKVSDRRRLQAIFSNHIRELIRLEIKNNQEEFENYSLLNKKLSSSSEVKLPGIMVINTKEDKAINLDVFWYNEKHHMTGRIYDDYDNSNYGEYIKDGYNITNIKNIVIYADLWDAETASEFKSDLKYNWAYKAYIFDMYLNRPLEVFNKRFGAVFKQICFDTK